MSGITGIYAFNQVGGFYMINLAKSIDAMLRRGPDVRGSFVGNDLVALGYRGHAASDPSFALRQPFTEATERFTIVCDAEMHSTDELKIILEEQGHAFQTQNPGEILLQAYIQLGKKCVDNLQGGFAFAIYDALEKTMYLACDPSGIRHLFYYQDEDKFIFATDLKAMVAYNIPKELDAVSIVLYGQLNFIPGNETPLKEIYKLAPGCTLFIENKNIAFKNYHIHEHPIKYSSFDLAKEKLQQVLEDRVTSILKESNSIGVQLDGRLSNNVLAYLAAKNSVNFRSYSLNLERDTKEAKALEAVALKLKTDHTTFYLHSDDLREAAKDLLSNIDTPIADMQMIYNAILYKKLKSRVKSLLSPLGAEALFGGLDYYSFEYRLDIQSGKLSFFKNYAGLLKLFLKDQPLSLLHLLREYGTSKENRFWKQFGNSDNDHSKNIWETSLKGNTNEIVEHRKSNLLVSAKKKLSLEALVKAYVNIALPGKHMFAVDAAASGEGIEVVFPFLSREMYDLATKIPAAWKVDAGNQSIILRDAFTNNLPDSVIASKSNNSNETFNWMLEAIRPMMLEDNLLDSAYLRDQGIFEPNQIKILTNRRIGKDLQNNDRILWNILVFQHWHKKFMNY